MSKRWVVYIAVIVAAILWMAGAAEVFFAEEPRATTVGTVVSSSVEVRRNPLAREAAKRTLYVPVIVYEYDVGGTVYRNDVMWAGLAPDEESSVPIGAELVVADYPVGSEVPVYYVPDDPQDSVLKVAEGPGWILVGMGGLVFLGAAVYGWRHRATLDEKSG